MANKRTRIINGCIAVAIAIAISTLTIVEWKSQGCMTSSLIAGLAMYNGIIAALWNCVDAFIKEKEG